MVQDVTKKWRQMKSLAIFFCVHSGSWLNHDSREDLWTVKLWRVCVCGACAHRCVGIMDLSEVESSV